MMLERFRPIILFALAVFILSATSIYGATNDSVILMPSKLELTASPGEIIHREFTLINQTESDIGVTLHFESLATPVDLHDGAALAEGVMPISSLTTHLSTEKQNFILTSHRRTSVPIIIKLPENISPGGYYGAAVFSITPTSNNLDNGPRFVTRLAGLMFVRVTGPVIESGTLLDFNLLGKPFRFSIRPPTFYLTFKNTGTIYLNPYGSIGLKNKFGGEKVDLAIDPWFVLPDNTRIRELTPSQTLSSGWYEARLLLHHGYSDGDIIDNQSINFIIITPTVILGGGLGLIILLIIIFMIRRKHFRPTALAFVLTLAFVNIALAEVASSTNYRLQADSFNFGGLLSTSANYRLEDTAGEIGTGNSTSTNYALLTGYQQMVSSIIGITAPTDVTLSSIAGTGVSSGSVALTVTTDGPARYTLSIKAGSNPSLTAGAESFDDYSPSGASPDYDWTVATTEAAFCISPEGVSIASRYLNSGSTCGSGASDDADSCWDGFSTTNRTIAQSSAANTPSGTATTVKLKAEIGSSKTQPEGNFAATLTVTAMPR